jgi:hypothetical protein
VQRYFTYGGEKFPQLEHEQSTLYLGSPVGGSRKERAKPAQARLDQMHDDAIKITNSDLVNVQTFQKRLRSRSLLDITR